MKKISVILVLTLLMSPFVWSQIINIPDTNFKNALLNTNCADFNGDGNFTSQVDLNNDDEIQLSEVIGIQGLRVSNQNIVSLEGIENFVNLSVLNVQFNDIVTMDISALANLTSLLCDSNALTTLDVSSNLNLEGLFCSDNQLTDLDVSLNTNLVNFECFINLFTNIDISSNVNLETLNCSVNPISELDVTNNLQLIWLLASNANLSELNITNNTLLENLSVENNNLTSIDLSQNPNLFTIGISNNLLTEISISDNPNVLDFNVQNNDLTNADIKNGTALMEYSGFFGNPNLAFICADDFEIPSVQAQLDALGYSETLVSDDCNLSVADIANSVKTQVFPNPFLNQIFITSDAPLEYIHVYDMNGQQILNIYASGFDAVIDVSELASGFYILKVDSSKGTAIKNVIKQ